MLYMMMALRQTRNIIIPLLTLHMSLLLPEASFGMAVKCWWHRVFPDSHDVSIECQADPQGSMLECDLCHVRIRRLNQTAHISQTGCSHTNASFSTIMHENELQNSSCALLCPGHEPGHDPEVPCMVQKGYPPPTCLIPFDDAERNIHCHWTLNPLIPTNFTLNWREEDADGISGHEDVGESDSGIIPRVMYSLHKDINIWVSAASTFGKINSETLKINTKSIFQPVVFINRHFEPLEIFWDVHHDTESGQSKCKVQYKKQCDHFWTENKDTFEVSFLLQAEPFTTYTFRVCCSRAVDERAVMSDWSPEYTVETLAAAPVGMLDAWFDCDSAPDNSSLTILWKEMPKQQARGKIQGYLIAVKLKNGSVSIINGAFNTSTETCASHAQQSNLPCVQDQSCVHYLHLSIAVKDVKAIEVTANTVMGKSSPALLALPKASLLETVKALEVRGKYQELHVVWTVLPQDSTNVQEYVVQHKPLGQPASKCLNWVRVPKNQTSVTLRGQFLNYTAYNVSLFAVLKESTSCLLKSVIAYTVEGVPPIITDLQAIPTSLKVNLTWTPIPLHKSQGHIIQYLWGFSNDLVVHNVSSKESSVQLLDLNPDEQYKVWICAKTSAGEGERATATFTTMHSGNITSVVVLIFIGVFLVPLIIITFIFTWYVKGKATKCFYIPDPINSSSFKQMSSQFWHPLPASSASMEHGLTISQVEVIPDPEDNREPEVVEQPEEHREHEHSRGKVLRGLEGLQQNNSTLHHQKEYSQMVDTSDEEEKDDKDEEWNEPFISDYEKHFMPCIVDA